MRLSRLFALVALVPLGVACGGSDEGNPFSGAGGGATAGSGTAGSEAAGSGTAGSATAGSGTAGSGTSGSGTAGSGTSGSGQAGASPCPGGCDDGVGCTVDTCGPAGCVHTPGDCGVGKVCDVTKGCVESKTCANDDPCLSLWGADACKTNVHCDTASATCTFDPLDKDKDGHTPVACGGDDCDDADATRFGGAKETCDGKDNDCDGQPDDGATCSGLDTCQAGKCACAPANTCGSECVDKNTSLTHCGACNAPCGPNTICQGGKCACQKTPCGNLCVDTQVDTKNCGGCGLPCPAGAACQAAKCVCGGGATLCSNKCVDTKTDLANCGGCNKPCAGTCTGGVCKTCTPGAMLILIDRSGSMATTEGSFTRLQKEVEAVDALAGESSGVSMGILVYPRGSSATLCAPGDYATPDVAIQPMPAGANAIASVLAGVQANLSSVMTPALHSAVAITRNWALANGGPAVVVVINDGGVGNACQPNDTYGAAAGEAAAGVNGTPSIATYVIGVGDDTTGPPGWSTVAMAGGTSSINVGTGPSASYLDALRSIRDVVACKLRRAFW